MPFSVIYSYSGRRGASCEVYHNRSTRVGILHCLDRPIENAIGVVKISGNWEGGKIGEGIIGF